MCVQVKESEKSEAEQVELRKMDPTAIFKMVNFI